MNTSATTAGTGTPVVVCGRNEPLQRRLARTGPGIVRGWVADVLWTCWGRDWTASATPASVERGVLRRLTGGGTVLLHDSDHFAAPRSWEAMLGALPGILTTCRVRGWEVGPLREHFGDRRRFSTLSAPEV